LFLTGRKKKEKKWGEIAGSPERRRGITEKGKGNQKELGAHGSASVQGDSSVHLKKRKRHNYYPEKELDEAGSGGGAAGASCEEKFAATNNNLKKKRRKSGSFLNP